MGYYRKAAAVFIVVVTLLTPVFLKKEMEVAVVDMNQLIEKSKYLSTLDKKNKTDEKSTDKIMDIIENSSREYAINNDYSSVITGHAVYKGGENITEKLAQKIDKNNKSFKDNKQGG